MGDLFPSRRVTMNTLVLFISLLVAIALGKQVLYTDKCPFTRDPPKEGPHGKCGDGICAGPEDPRNCFEDCGSCGDGCCQSWESEGEALRDMLCADDCDYHEVCSRGWKSECQGVVGSK